MATTDAMARLQAAKNRADADQRVRDGYEFYVQYRVEHGGWTNSDVQEYREEVKRIMSVGTEDEKLAAQEFWDSKRSAIKQRIAA